VRQSSRIATDMRASERRPHLFVGALWTTKGGIERQIVAVEAQVVRWKGPTGRTTTVALEHLLRRAEHNPSKTTVDKVEKARSNFDLLHEALAEIQSNQEQMFTELGSMRQRLERLIVSLGGL
jgi:hypothetical protein